MLLLTVLFPTLLFVETDDDGVTSDFLHKYLHFLLQGLLSGCTLYCGQSIVHLIMSYFYYGQPRIMPSSKFQDTAFPLRKHIMRPGKPPGVTIPY